MTCFSFRTLRLALGEANIAELLQSERGREAIAAKLRERYPQAHVAIELGTNAQGAVRWAVYTLDRPFHTITFNEQGVTINGGAREALGAELRELTPRIAKIAQRQRVEGAVRSTGTVLSEERDQEGQLVLNLELA